MRYVPRVEPLRVGQATFGLGEFLMYYVDGASRFVSGQRGIRAGMRITEAIREFEGDPSKDLPPLGHLALEEEDWQALRDELEAPKLLRMGEVEPPAYPISPARNCVRFLDALAEAKTEKPKCEPPECASENAKAPRKRGGKAEPAPVA